MEKYFLNAPQLDENITDAQFAELLLEKVLFDVRKSTLLEEIDQSLLAKNKDEFFRLTEELKRIS
ncbi:IDEAL domain-containing protein [Ectobacillus sp. sgz5001026]|uniref:IDEAL domain-containing protein n=1 Tax=Ectobacillus sp. sgz5001026 TaxID=3242473 RepID=UPI0036D3FD9F